MVEGVADRYPKLTGLFRIRLRGRPRGNCGKRTGMKQCAFRLGLSGFAFWFCTMPAVPAEGVRLAQATQNPPPARAPRLPTTGQVTPAVPSGESSRAQIAPQTNSGQAPATPQVPTRTEILNFENWALTCNESDAIPKAKRCTPRLQTLQQN